MGGRTGWGAAATRLAIGITALTGAVMMSGCLKNRGLPWRSKEAVTDRAPGVPPIMLGSTEGRHLIVMRAPSGGWSLHADKQELRPNGRRVYLTVRRPDPAFVHTQALVDLRVLTEIDAETPIEVVARVLDRNEKPRDRIYGQIEPVGSLD